MNRLCQLLIASEVYRDGWEPDLLDGEPKYVIHIVNDEACTSIATFKNHVLSFPTEEISEEFFENFRELIYEAKELL